MSLLVVQALRSISRRSISYSAVACGKGDGSSAGGSINQGGDKFGEIEAAQESAYFKKLEMQQLGKLKKHHDDEIKHHEEEIQRHLDSIKRHREKMSDLDKKPKKSSGSDSD